MANRLWTPAEDEIIRRERAASTPAPEIAAMLGRPIHATRNRALKIGTRVQARDAWTPAERQMLRELVDIMPPLHDRDIASRLGRSATSIRWALNSLGLTHRRGFPTREESAAKRQREALIAAKKLEMRQARDKARIDLATARAAERARVRQARLERQAALALEAVERKRAREEAAARRDRERAEKRDLKAARRPPAKTSPPGPKKTLRPTAAPAKKQASTGPSAAERARRDEMMRAIIARQRQSAENRKTA